MARVTENLRVSGNYYLLKTDYKTICKPGQFFMLRAWENYPTLSRPISILRYSDGAEFLYEVRGEGTEILKNLKQKDEIKIFGPYGNTFETDVDELAMIAGGVGAAPFYHLAETIKKKNKFAKLTLYLGQREDVDLRGIFSKLDVELVVKSGGFITDEVDFKRHKNIYACGPSVMMEKIYRICKDLNKDVYVSTEMRMGCGVGVCLSCSVDTTSGRKRSCKEGPIFLGSELYGI